MIIYFHRDGSQTISRALRRLSNEDRHLEYDAVRIVEVRDDGAIIVKKDRYGTANRELLSPLPLGRVTA
jgi:hypothetical protein